MSRYEPTVPLPDPLDNKTINDPTAWGFCDYCAFMVAVYDGVLVHHKRHRTSADDSTCRGSGQDPKADIPLEAKPRLQVSLHKDFERARSRASCQRWRLRARDKARERRAVRDGTLNKVDIKIVVSET